jgi:putative tryptophan/tyrosine transport system substrate-binding protein
MPRRDFIAALGSAATLPLTGPPAAWAQQRSAPVIGYLDAGSESARAPFTAAFRRGLGDQGYAEGRNVEILYRWAESRYDRLPALAAELVRERVAVIHAQSTPAALAAKSATPFRWYFHSVPTQCRLASLRASTVQAAMSQA